MTVLMANDPPPLQIINPAGVSPFLLIGDHAGNRVPERLDRLGLPDTELSRHIGWDIGIGELGAMLADALDAVFIRQTYSRLVIDCNRDPARADAMPEISDRTVIPGNQNLTAAMRADRVAGVHAPYHQAIGAEILRRDAARMPTILIALHSFTPAMQGVARPWHVGVLHDGGDARYARALLTVLQTDATFTVGDNQPYSMGQIDYSVPLHAYPAKRRYAEIEVRQDLISTTAGCAEWCARLDGALRHAATA